MNGEPLPVQDGHQDPTEYAVQHVRERLAMDPRTNELEVRVSVAGTKVFLDGAVSSPERREAISEVAHEALPDHDVHNQITVLQPRPAEEAEELT